MSNVTCYISRPRRQSKKLWNGLRGIDIEEGWSGVIWDSDALNVVNSVVSLSRDERSS